MDWSVGNGLVDDGSSPVPVSPPGIARLPGSDGSRLVSGRRSRCRSRIVLPQSDIARSESGCASARCGRIGHRHSCPYRRIQRSMQNLRCWWIGRQQIRRTGQAAVAVVVMNLGAGIPNQKQIARLGFPMRRAPGNQIADCARMGDAAVELVVNIVDIEGCHLQAVCAMVLRQRLDCIEEARVRDDQIIETIARVAQIAFGNSAHQRRCRACPGTKGYNCTPGFALAAR